MSWYASHKVYFFLFSSEGQRSCNVQRSTHIYKWGIMQRQQDRIHSCFFCHFRPISLSTVFDWVRFDESVIFLMVISQLNKSTITMALWKATHFTFAWSLERGSPRFLKAYLWNIQGPRLVSYNWLYLQFLLLFPYFYTRLPFLLWTSLTDSFESTGWRKAGKGGMSPPSGKHA